MEVIYYRTQKLPDKLTQTFCNFVHDGNQGWTYFFLESLLAFLAAFLSGALIAFL